MCSVAVGQLYDVQRSVVSEETDVHTMYRGRWWGVQEKVTHLQWLCDLKSYLCYICRSAFQVFLGCIRWQGPGCVLPIGTYKIVHSGYNPSTLANDVALLRLPTPLIFTSEYPSPVSLILLCMYYGHRWLMFNTVVSEHLTIRHPYNRFCYPQW